MNIVLGNMGRAFLKAFVASIIVILPGLASQPDLHSAVGIGIAGVIASGVAGLTAIQTYIPQLTFEHWFGNVHGAIVDTFARLFLSYLVVAIIGVMQEPGLSTWHAISAAVVAGAIGAATRAVQGLLSPGQYPVPAIGLPAPPKPPQSLTAAPDVLLGVATPETGH